MLTGRILKSGKNRDGYSTVVLVTDEGETLSRKVHRLVAQNFYEEVPSSYQVNHVDTEKSNNFVGNLEWTTQSGNQRHAFQHGLHRGRRGGRIRVVETGEIFETQHEVARAIGGFQSAVNLCLNGKRQKHNGYTFEWVE